MSVVHGKQAVLAVSFGTTCRDACERAIGAIEGQLAGAFPGWTVRRAFTSGMIRGILRERDGLCVDSVEQALERLADEGYARVLCQPTHVIAGAEYEGMLRALEPFRSRFGARAAGPLLAGAEDYPELCRHIRTAFAPPADTALCLMGHGSAHPADSAYAALAYHLAQQGMKNCFVGTVEGYPDLDTLTRQVERSGLRKVLLAPLMVVAGDHARNDMAGDGADSWKSHFIARGFAVRCLLRGLGEFPEIRAMYVRHARQAAERMA